MIGYGWTDPVDEAIMDSPPPDPRWTALGLLFVGVFFFLILN